MRRVESMLLAVQLKDMINYPLPAFKILEALTAASCQETFCYERAELLGDAYLKWVVSRFLFLKYPQKHEGQLTRMRQQMVSNMVLYQFALNKRLQSFIQADRFAPSRWASPGVLLVFYEDTKDADTFIFGEGGRSAKTESEKGLRDDGDEYDMEDREVESDLSCYRVLSSKTLADVVEALISVYYVEGGKNAAHHLMNWIGIQVEFDPKEIEHTNKPCNVPESILRSVNFDALESALNIKFRDRGLLVEAITHASRPSSEFPVTNDRSLSPMVTPETLLMHLVRELQEQCQQQAEGLEYKATRNGNLATVEVYIDGLQIGSAQNPQK
ncbi:hypothetical protein IFM89_015622 [Coptis chinensis]|uniref:RNase III domain-containing protein n=1 Tax=Coptis chinensis TaxID=261450 RepID=A0A835LY72_9MAGN|nr:hypothetical protein IFM89_015622 [Coptis chinensis]